MSDLAPTPPVKDQTITVKKHCVWLQTRLATVDISDGVRSENISTWIAKYNPTNYPVAAVDCVVRIFDTADEPGKDCLPGEFDQYNLERQIAHHLVVKKNCHYVLCPYPVSGSIGMTLPGRVQRKVLVYRKPEGDDWEGLEGTKLDNKETWASVKAALVEAIQRLFEADYCLVESDLSQVIWSKAQAKRILLDLAATTPVPKAYDRSYFDPETALANLAFPITFSADD